MAKPENKFWKKLWSNFVVRNLVLAFSLLIIALFVITILLNIFTRHNKYKDVPAFTGITLKEANRLAEKDRLKIEVNDSLFVPAFEPGVILEQKPEAGTKVKSGRRVFVTVNSFSQKMVDVPYVVGYSLRQGKNILEGSGLEVAKLVYVNDIATNNILGQEVNGITVTRDKTVTAEMGSGVVLTVGRSHGNEQVLVPRVAGLSLREAQSRLWEVGLNVAKPVMDNDVNLQNQRNAKVYKQTPDQNHFAALGREVKLYLTTDSLRIAQGSRQSDNVGQTLARERYVMDSLTNEGLGGQGLQDEYEWIRKLDKGEARPEDRPRREDEVLPIETESYEREMVPIDNTPATKHQPTQDDDFFGI